MYIFKIEFIEEIFNIAEIIKNYSLELKQSKLYKYNKNFFLCLYIECYNDPNLDNVIYKIGCKNTRCKWTILNDVILQEWGYLISENVIENIIAAV